MVVAIIGLFTTTNTVLAQTRTKIADGLTLVRYGNTAVIEDDKNQKTWNLSVTREQKSTGEWVYYIACGNKYSKNAIKSGLAYAIKDGVASLSIPGFAAAALSGIALVFYDDVCDYFGEGK